MPKFSHEYWPSLIDTARVVEPYLDLDILGHRAFAFRDFTYVWTHLGTYSAPFFDLNPHRFPRQRSPYRTFTQLEADTFEDRKTPQEYICTLYARGCHDIYDFLHGLDPTQTKRILRFMLSHDALLRRLK